MGWDWAEREMGWVEGDGDSVGKRVDLIGIGSYNAC